MQKNTQPNQISDTLFTFFLFQIQKLANHLVPIIPRIAYRWVVHGHNLYLGTIVQGIVATLVDVTVNDDVRIPRPPFSCWHVAPKARAPHDDILRTILLQHLEEQLCRIFILLVRSRLARPAHRRLQVVVEHHGVPDLLPFRPIRLMPNQRPLKLQVR